ncbi:MAG TPA: hypothetical protein VGV06_13285 [Methylomirabilota bacterium]|nr:hypothetical protein [Methylomirabilota bacterium]
MGPAPTAAAPHRGGALWDFSRETIARLQALALPSAVAILTFVAFLPTLENNFVD